MQSNAHELAALLQRYIFQEYSSQSWLEVSRESYLHYRSYATSLNHNASNKVPQKPEIKPTQVIPKQDTPIKKEEPVLSKPTHTSTVIQIEEKKELPKQVILEQSSKIEVQDLSDIRKIFSERFPEQMILLEPPSDSLAKTIKNGWKNANTQKFFLATHIQPQYTSFINNLQHAIKMVYAKDLVVIDINKEIPEFAIKIPNLDVYLRDSKQKAHLWQQISKQLSPT